MLDLHEIIMESNNSMNKIRLIQKVTKLFKLEITETSYIQIHLYLIDREMSIKHSILKYLYGAKMCIEKILSHPVTLVKLSAHTGRAKAAPYTIPLIGTSNPPTKPAGVVVEMIF